MYKVESGKYGEPDVHEVSSVLVVGLEGGRGKLS